MRIALSADHAGYEMKDQLADWLRADGHEIVDLGTNTGESVDYPRYGALLADALTDGRAERGITVCGSASGSPLPPTAIPPAAARRSASRSRPRWPASTTTATLSPSARA